MKRDIEKLEAVVGKDIKLYIEEFFEYGGKNENMIFRINKRNTVNQRNVNFIECGYLKPGFMAYSNYPHFQSISISEYGDLETKHPYEGEREINTKIDDYKWVNNLFEKLNEN
jgi:hypothetical protein